MSRHRSSVAETFGNPVHEKVDFQLALCPTCKTALEFTPDAIGRLRERCPQCDGNADRIRPAFGPYTPQTALTNSPIEALRAEIERLTARPLLPEIEPGQLRCQRCAKGVEGDRRFCSATCRRPARDKPVVAAIVTPAGICPRCQQPLTREPGQRGRPPKTHRACRTPGEIAELERKTVYNEIQRQRAKDGSA